MSTTHRPSTDASTPDEPTFIPRFTDWRGGCGPNNDPDPENEQRLVNRTLAMGNWTTLDPYEENSPAHAIDWDGKTHFERLDRHNRDCWWKYREDVDVRASTDRRYKQVLVDVFAGQLDLNAYCRECAFEELMSLDLRRTGWSVVMNAFVVCAIVANEEAKRYGEENLYHPQRSDERNDAAFLRLEQYLIERYPRIAKATLTSVYNKLTQGTPRRRAPETWKPYFRHEPLVPQDAESPPAQFEREAPS